MTSPRKRPLANSHARHVPDAGFSANGVRSLRLRFSSPALEKLYGIIARLGEANEAASGERHELCDGDLAQAKQCALLATIDEGGPTLTEKKSGPTRRHARSMHILRREDRKIAAKTRAQPFAWKCFPVLPWLAHFSDPNLRDGLPAG